MWRLAVAGSRGLTLPRTCSQGGPDWKILAPSTRGADELPRLPHRLLQEYLTCGGFPRAVAEQVRDGQVSTAYLKDLQAWLLTDVDADAPPESISRLLSELEQRGSSPLNVTAAAETLGYPNRPTLDRRVDRLVATFAALRCPQRSDDGNIIIGSRPKVYLADPLLGWLPHLLRRTFSAAACRHPT